MEEIISHVEQGEVVPHFNSYEKKDKNGKIVEVLEKNYTSDDFIEIALIGD